MSASKSEQLLCDLLKEGGYVSSFVDLFYLIHRTSEENDEPGDNVEMIENVRDILVRCENERREGRVFDIIESYSSIASIYKERGLHKISRQYSELTHGVSKLTGESVSMTQALHDLGLACEASGDFESARIYHEENRDLAKKHNLSDTVILANTRLLHVYTTLATKEGNLEKALELNLCALEAAQEAGNLPAEGECNWSVGKMLVALNRPADSIPYLKNFLRITASVPGLENRLGQAFAALAAGHKAAGDLDAAAECLDELITIADQTNNPLAHSEAAETLGALQAQNGDLELANACLEASYIRRKALLEEHLVTRADVDRSRVLVGVTRGDTRLQALLKAVVDKDMDRLLRWKTQTVDLLPPEMLRGTIEMTGKLLRTGAGGGVVSHYGLGSSVTLVPPPLHSSSAVSRQFPTASTQSLGSGAVNIEDSQGTLGSVLRDLPNLAFDTLTARVEGGGLTLSAASPFSIERRKGNVRFMESQAENVTALNSSFE